jgi:hypothetical protein
LQPHALETGRLPPAPRRPGTRPFWHTDLAEIWIIETKGREDLDDPPKWERLQQWCADATAHDGKRSFQALFVRQEDWDAHKPKNFGQLAAGFQ